METAENLLFEKIFDGKPLFNSQVDLVNWLLTTYNSGYYVDKVNHFEYSKNLNRLKAYVSQLLSGGVARNVTPLFKHSLELVLRKRLESSSLDADDLIRKILADLDSKNKKVNALGSISREFSGQTSKDLYFQLAEATDVLVITGRPVDVQTEQLSLQKFLVYELMHSLTKPDSVKKRYRFNFPHRQMADIFWYNLRKAIETNLIPILTSEKIIEHFYLSSYIQLGLYHDLKDTPEFSNEKLSIAANSVLQFLSAKQFISVYVVDEPIFSVPMIILHPDSRHASAFLILESDNGSTTINRLCREDIFAWKFAVWDRLKTKSAGQPIYYEGKTPH